MDLARASEMASAWVRPKVIYELRKSLDYAEHHPPGPESATLRELHRSFVFLVEGFMDRIQSASWDAKRDRPMDRKLARQYEEMRDFLFPEAIPGEDEMIEDIIRSGGTLDFARQVVQQSRQRRGYRRIAADFRAEVIRAHDLKLTGKNLAQITAAVCSCGQETHSDACRKKTVRRLSIIKDLLEPVR